jgi:hypothetical protein
MRAGAAGPRGGPAAALRRPRGARSQAGPRATSLRPSAVARLQASTRLALRPPLCATRLSMLSMLGPGTACPCAFDFPAASSWPGPASTCLCIGTCGRLAVPRRRLAARCRRRRPRRLLSTPKPRGLHMLGVGALTHPWQQPHARLRLRSACYQCCAERLGLARGTGRQGAKSGLRRQCWCGLPVLRPWSKAAAQRGNGHRAQWAARGARTGSGAGRLATTVVAELVTSSAAAQPQWSSSGS